MQDAQQCGWYSRARAHEHRRVNIYSTPDGREVAVTGVTDCRALDDPVRSRRLGVYRGPVVKWLRNVDPYSAQPRLTNTVDTPADAFENQEEPPAARQQVEALLARITAGYDVPGDEMEDVEPLVAHASLREIAPYGRRQYQRQAQGQPDSSSVAYPSRGPSGSEPVRVARHTYLRAEPTMPIPWLARSNVAGRFARQQNSRSNRP
ncbi:hypothetical protein pqer_cds_697 [Pandoravirus quercus]|uniref:Uncharacterized protein n=1 Tax=Pandoravirus quercus TaxID=2107709 RepID=A0A2U7U9K8_9VIRU|nr:hypothetical protein pqer_cds_697 [Pandoravirus quercus]AVK75119.1 hypothetical protein pqer_cds_697 [Pandoravirus quercus]